MTTAQTKNRTRHATPHVGVHHGQTLRDLLKRLQIPQAALARKLGVSRQAIRKAIEDPSWGTHKLETYSQALGVSRDVFVNGDVTIAEGPRTAKPNDHEKWDVLIAAASTLADHKVIVEIFQVCASLDHDHRVIARDLLKTLIKH